ncbi:unnamed protein product [Cladocopium goreaui]|uniref:Kinesin-like protein KIF2C n=1 Tax=Cladocopium goreaui TaxID=2562237 RepID=A0A9P1CV85_9DINO|nr:unnamed protein product [Cladocopium goreaui]
MPSTAIVPAPCARAGEASWHAVGQSACGLNGCARRPRRLSTSWGLYSNGLSQRQRRRFIKVQAHDTTGASCQQGGRDLGAAVWRGQRSRQVLRSKGYVLPGDRRLAEYGRAATQLQDCPEVDLEELLNDARRVAEADPFGYLSLPQVAVAPMAAWGTPPSTGTPETPKSQPDPGGLAGPRRSRSLSSTAESATIEAEGHGVHRGTRVEQAKEEWGFKDASTARNYLKAQKRRQAKQERPPTLPSTSSRSNLTQKSSSSRVRPGEGSCQSAQQAIEEYRRQQEAWAPGGRGRRKTLKARVAFRSSEVARQTESALAASGDVGWGQAMSGGWLGDVES